MNPFLDINAEVSSALANNKPVVALESTIISHGMPYPRNIETALEVENIVRESGAIPATIAIINGRLKAGLSSQEIEVIGKAGLSANKVSRRDIPAVLASEAAGSGSPSGSASIVGADNFVGATTVAATMIISAMAGIRLFATGGIGGVHRGSEKSFDISADLDEFANTPVAVVCAGAKSILDIPKTLEYLETRGVPVVVYKSDEFPAFYTSRSGVKAHLRMDSAALIAKMLRVKWQLGLSGGAVIANPIPVLYEMPPAAINAAIDEALALAEKSGIHGPELTPFLLDRVKTITGGDSLESNIALVKNNARLASEIAGALLLQQE